MRKFIDLETGQIILDGISLGKTITIKQLKDSTLGNRVKSKLFADGDVNLEINNIKWNSDNGELYTIDLDTLFTPVCLKSCFVNIYNRDWPYIANWDDYSFEREKEKTKFLEEWANKFIGPLGEYPWGKIKIALGDFARFRIDYLLP